MGSRLTEAGYVALDGCACDGFITPVQYSPVALEYIGAAFLVWRRERKKMYAQGYVAGYGDCERIPLRVCDACGASPREFHTTNLMKFRMICDCGRMGPERQNNGAATTAWNEAQKAPCNHSAPLLCAQCGEEMVVNVRPAKKAARDSD